MEVNEQTLYDDALLNILPDGVIILDINGKIIQLNQQALTELHVHSSVNTMMPLPTSQIFKLLNNKEDILSTILEKISQGERIYTLPEHTYIQGQQHHILQSLAFYLHYWEHWQELCSLFFHKLNFRTFNSP